MKALFAFSLILCARYSEHNVRGILNINNNQDIEDLSPIQFLRNLKHSNANKIHLMVLSTSSMKIKMKILSDIKLNNTFS